MCIRDSTTDEEREIYDIVLRSNQALIDAAKAGMTRRDYDKVARDVIVEAGYGCLLYTSRCV